MLSLADTLIYVAKSFGDSSGHVLNGCGFNLVGVANFFYYHKPTIVEILNPPQNITKSQPKVSYRLLIN